jgi:hypothetical protein
LKISLFGGDEKSAAATGNRGLPFIRADRMTASWPADIIVSSRVRMFLLRVRPKKIFDGLHVDKANAASCAFLLDDCRPDEASRNQLVALRSFQSVAVLNVWESAEFFFIRLHLRAHMCVHHRLWCSAACGTLLG